MDRKCNICGKQYPERWMLSVFTGRTHWFCWSCYKKGHGEAIAVEIQEQRQEGEGMEQMNDMSAGIQSEICKKKHQPGALVMVSVQTDGAQIKNPAAKFNGQTFKIEYRHQPKPTVRPQFTLVGCESEYGLPYWFTEEQLILI